jgi:hypothetical protein
VIEEYGKAGIFARCFFLWGSKQKPLGLGKIKHRWNAREMGVVVDDEWMEQVRPCRTLLSSPLTMKVEECRGKQMRNEEERLLVFSLLFFAANFVVWFIPSFARQSFRRLFLVF